MHEIWSRIPEGGKNHITAVHRPWIIRYFKLGRFEPAACPKSVRAIDCKWIPSRETTESSSGVEI
jgi:hypothetical protein